MYLILFILTCFEQAWAVADLEKMAKKVGDTNGKNENKTIVWLDTSFGGITRLLFGAAYYPTCYFAEHGTNQI